MHLRCNFSWFSKGLRIIRVVWEKIPRLLFTWFTIWVSGPLLLAESKLVVLGDPDLVALVEAGLSQDPEVALLDREQIRPAQREQILSQSAGMARLPTPDFYFLVKNLEGKIHANIVRAGTSEWMAGDLFPNVAAVVSWFEQAPKETFIESDFRVAVLHGATPTEITTALKLRQELQSAGFRIFNRDLVEKFLQEEEDVAGGFLAPPDGLLPAFPGADLLLVLKESGSRIKVLSIDGAMLGEWKMDASGRESLFSFVEERRAEDPAWIAAQYQQRVSAEALEKYFRGVELMETGYPLEATEFFQQAAELNNQWIEAYLAEARCYDQVGLPELADALRRWVMRGFQGRTTAAAANTQPRNGITFLGVTATDTTRNDVANSLTLAAIEQLAGPELLLPGTLQTITREMDLVTLGQRGEGARWTTSPGFVSRRVLRGVLRGEKCRWILSDELAGQTLAVREHSMPTKRALDLSWLADFVNESEGRVAPSEKQDFFLPTEAELRAKLGKKTRPQEENLIVLQTLLRLPGEPLAIGGQLNKSSRETVGLNRFLAYGKREALMRLLPTDHPMRPWVELEQIQTYLPWRPVGPILSGREENSSALLLDFAQRNAGHEAALLARYLWLYDEQARLPPAEVARLAKELESDLRANRTLPRVQDLANFCATLGLLGEAADGQHERLDFSGTSTPYHVRFEISPKGEIVIKNNDKWRVNEYKDFALAGADLVNEAQAVLALQGRGHRGHHLQTSWLTKFPHSISLASYAAFGVMNSSQGRTGLFFEDEEEPAESGTSLPQQTLHYIVATMDHWMPQLQNEKQFHHLDYTLAYLFPAVVSGHHDISHEGGWELHKRMKNRMAETAQRIGVRNTSRVKPREFMLDWRELTPEIVACQQKDSLLARPKFYIDWTRKGAALQEAARVSILSDPPTHREWWQQLNVEWNNTLSYREFATQQVLPLLPSVQKAYGEGSLTDDERAFLLDVGTILLWGWRFAEAEEIFNLVAAGAPAPGSEEATCRALRGNALFQLARLHRRAGQNVEAMRSLMELLGVTEGMTVPLLTRVKPTFRRSLQHPPTVRENLRSLAMRLLEDLRFEPTRAILPEHAGVFSLATRQLDNPEVPFFYRLPEEKAPAGILLVLLGFNEGAAALQEPGNFLVQFAEAHDLAILGPQFSQPLSSWTADNPSSPYHIPQLWSGELIERGLRELKSRVGVSEEKNFPLHVVGFGTGAQLGSRLLRWHPDLVSSLSINFPVTSPWLENERGLQPFTALRDKPVQILIAKEQDFATHMDAPLLTAELFHAALVEAGANAALHLIDTSATRVDESTQQAISLFLRQSIEQNQP